MNNAKSEISQKSERSSKPVTVSSKGVVERLTANNANGNTKGMLSRKQNNNYTSHATGTVNTNTARKAPNYNNSELESSRKFNRQGPGATFNVNGNGNVNVNTSQVQGQVKLTKQKSMKSVLLTAKAYNTSSKLEASQNTSNSRTNNHYQQTKATHMVSKREKEKVLARLRGLMDLVNSCEIAADNMPEILATVDKLGEAIKRT